MTIHGPAPPRQYPWDEVRAWQGERQARISITVPYFAWPWQLPQVGLCMRRQVCHSLRHTLGVLACAESLEDGQRRLQPLLRRLQLTLPEM